MRCRATLSDGGKPRAAPDDGGDSSCELFECPVAIAINSQLSPGVIESTPYNRFCVSVTLSLRLR